HMKTFLAEQADCQIFFQLIFCKQVDWFVRYFFESSCEIRNRQIKGSWKRLFIRDIVGTNIEQSMSFTINLIQSLMRHSVNRDSSFINPIGCQENWDTNQH